MPIIIKASVLTNRHETKNENEASGENVAFNDIVVPGEVIFTSGANLITGHGTYRPDQLVTGIVQQDHPQSQFEEKTRSAISSSTLPMHASLAGRLKSVNKLMYVHPPNARYAGNVGDTVVGRIVEVEQRRWKVEVNSYHLANLSLANVKLPTGELRRKSEDDERAMRSFMREGDLIVAEVREVYRDGSLQLHMPGKRTGRLGEGCLLRLPPSLIRRQRIHRHSLTISQTAVGLILGCNGLVWLGPAAGMDLGICLGAVISGTAKAATSAIALADRRAVTRVRNVVLALAAEGVPVWETSVLAGCEAASLHDFADTEDIADSNENVDDGDSFMVTRLLQTEYQHQLASLVADKLTIS